MSSSIELIAPCIEKINKQINMELGAFYAYYAIANHFSKTSIALFNVAKWFDAMAKEELEHAEKLREYLIKRGAIVQFSDIKAPTIPANLSLLQAFELALSMEQAVNNSLKELDHLAATHNETHLAAFIEDVYLSEQIDGEAELNGYIAQIKRAGAGLGEYIFDQHLQK